MSLNIRLIDNVLPDEILSAIPEDEAKSASEVLARPRHYALVGTQGGKPMFYAVLGIDRDGIVAAYFARAFDRLMGPILVKQLFGAAQLSGRPIRVHADTLGRMKAMARTAGATLQFEAVDGDGIAQGIFG